MSWMCRGGRHRVAHRRPGLAQRQQHPAVAQEHGVELALDLLQRHVRADAAVHARLHAQVDDALDFGIGGRA